MNYFHSSRSSELIYGKCTPYNLGDTEWRIFFSLTYPIWGEGIQFPFKYHRQRTTAYSNNRSYIVLVLPYNIIHSIKIHQVKMCFNNFQIWNLTSLICTKIYTSLETMQKAISSHEVLQCMIMHGMQFITSQCYDIVLQYLSIIRESRCYIST